MEVGSAFISLLPSAKDFGRSTERQIGPQMSGVAKRTGSRFGKVFAYSSMSPLKAIGAAAVGLFAVQKIKDFFGSAIDEARESQKVSAITAQVIKTTGGAANISAGQVGKLAASISNLTGIDDEAIQAGSNLLLTFTNLRNEAGRGNDVFNQATKIITDMSVALGTDVKGSAIQVGKALNDPIKGITALTRVGVSFTEQQKAQIKTLVDSGNTLGAQKIILGELRREFGGTAAAAATAGDRFRTTFANFQESVGTALLPLLDRLLVKGISVIGFLQADVPRAFEAFRSAITPAIEVVRTFVEDHLSAFKTALAALGGSALTSLIALIGGSFVSAIGVLVGALASPVALIGALAGAAIYAYTHFEQFRATVNRLAVGFQTNVLPALIQIGTVLRDDVYPILRGFVAFMATEFYPTMFRAWGIVAQKLIPVFQALGQAYVSRVLPVQRQVLEQLKQYGPIIGPVVAQITRMIAQLAILGATIAGKTLPPALRLATVLSGPMFSALLAAMNASNRAEAAMGNFAREMVQAIGSAQRFQAGVVSAVGKAINAVEEIPGKARNALGNLGNLLYAYGRDLIQGFINGIRDKAGEIVGSVTGPISAAVSGVKSLLKIGSPSKLFHQIGKWTMEGFANGIDEAGPKVLKAMQTALDKTLDKVTAFRDGIQSRLDSVKGLFSGLADSVASAFSVDLFQAGSVKEFFSGLAGQNNTLRSMLEAFKTLKGWGIPAPFLSQLFASGNSALILELATDRGNAQIAAGAFSYGQSLSAQLGQQVASNQYGPDLRDIRGELRRANNHLRHLDDLDERIAKAINGAVKHGQQKGAAA